jgi:RNA polymerase sigma-70 factor, ECF subfamily
VRREKARAHLIGELDYSGVSKYNPWAIMVRGLATVEHARTPNGEADIGYAADTFQLSAATYEKLRRLAAECLRTERPGHTLQPTALLHEAFLRVLKQPDYAWKDEAHIVAFAARAMRRILMSYGVARTRYKRGGPSAVRLPLDEALDFLVERDVNISAVDEALEELELVDSRQAQIVELRFFGCLTVDEIAAALKVSRATVKRDWVTAKLWLRSRLSV